MINKEVLKGAKLNLFKVSSGIKKDYSRALNKGVKHPLMRLR